MRSHMEAYETSYAGIWDLIWGEMRLAKCDVEAEFATVGQHWAVIWQAPMTYVQYSSLDAPDCFLIVWNSWKPFWNHFCSNFGDLKSPRQFFSIQNRKKWSFRIFFLSNIIMPDPRRDPIWTSKFPLVRSGHKMCCVLFFWSKKTKPWTERAGPLTYYLRKANG